MAERWNGATWVIQATPNPVGATTRVLRGVSCRSATACTAVGYSEGSNIPVSLAERWNGTSWVIQATPNPTGDTDNLLFGVSCGSATACTAVGRYSNASGSHTLAETWNGTTWAIQPTPDPAVTFIQLVGVSCRSATACTAVGDYTNTSGTEVTLAEAWDGTTWAIQPTPNPAGANTSLLASVSCRSATACIAVGSYYSNSSHAWATLAGAWDGTAWTIQATPNPPGATYSALYGVSCPSATFCAAVGQSENSTLAEGWNGSAWAIQGTPKTAGGSLEAVSCQSTTACVAVGDHLGSSGTPITLAEAWDGTAWTIQSTPNPPDDPAGTFVQLPGVSCLTTACTAVGSYYSNARNRDSSFALGKRGSSRQRPAEDRRQGLAEVSPEPRGALRRPIVTLQPSGAV